MCKTNMAKHLTLVCLESIGVSILQIIKPVPAPASEKDKNGTSKMSVVLFA